jgi:hypothetical protein
VWASADFLAWRINNGRIPQVNFQPPIGTLSVTTFDRNFTLQNNGSLTGGGLDTATNFQTGVFPFRIQNVPTLTGADNINVGEHLGGRFEAGVWLLPDQLCGIEGGAFYLTPRSALLANTAADANSQFLYTTPFVIRDFTITPSQAAPGGTPAPPTRTQTGTEPIFFVRQLNSTVQAQLTNSLWGAEINGRSTWSYFGPVSLGYLAGIRYANFNEDLQVLGNFQLFRPLSVGDALAPGGRLTDPLGLALPDQITIRTADTIKASNHFYGGQLGMDLDGECGRLWFNLRTKVAMGVNHQIVDVSGATATTTSGTTSNGVVLSPPGTTLMPGGLLSTPVDQVRLTRDRISFLPELNAKVGYQFCHWLRGYVGYDVLYLSDVIRPGDVLTNAPVSSTAQNSSAPSSVGQATAGVTTPTGASTTGAATQVGSTTNLAVTQPVIRYHDSNLWTQGFNFGIMIAY